jgi:hypothetical protein
MTWVHPPPTHVLGHVGMGSALGRRLREAYAARTSLKDIQADIALLWRESYHDAMLYQARG